MITLSKNLLLLLASISLMISLGETALRLIQPPGMVTSIDELSIADPILNHRHPENSEFRFRSLKKEFDTKVAFNSLGLRDYEYAKEKPEGTYRILVLGDSFVENSQVELAESFPKVLEGRLNEAAGSKYEVLNAGVSSYSPGVEYLYLKNVGIDLEPDLVLVYLYANDVTDDYIYSHIPDAAFDAFGLPLAFPAQQVGSSFREALYRNSHLYRLLSNRIKLLRVRNPGHSSGDVSSDFMAVFKDGPLTGAEKEAWALTEKYLLAINRLSHANGAGFAIVIAPPGIQVSPDEFKEGKKMFGFKPDEYIESSAMQERIKAIAADNGIPVLDLLPEFKRESAKRLLYYPYDGHWNRDGNRLAAEATDIFLQKSLLRSAAGK